MEQTIGSDSGQMPRSNDATVVELNRIVTKAEDLLASLGEAGGEAVANVRARVERTLRDAKSKIATSSVEAREMATDAAKRADHYVHANPWRAVALGVAVGAVAAAVIVGLVRR